MAALRAPSAGDVAVSLAPTSVAPSVDTVAAEVARAQAAGLASRPLTLAAGSTRLSVSQATLRGWFAFAAPAGQPYAPYLDADKVRATLRQLAPKVALRPKDAVFVTSGGKVVGVIASADGRSLDIPGSLARLQAMLRPSASERPPASVELATVSVAPAVSSQGVSAPLMRLLGSWTTPFVPGIANYYGNNIRIPARLINGTVVGAGQWFDFWQYVRLDPALGFGPGGFIKNGHTQETGALGGGICSCSTTLFNAALRAGLQMGARANHYYYITRYPLGLDATVWQEGNAQQTMSFRNDTAAPILIRGSSTRTSVTFQIFGVPDGRRVVLSTPIVRNYVAASDGIKYTPLLPHGVRERVEWPAAGRDVWVTRTVYTAAGAILHQETYYSHYARVDGLMLIGQ
jgi:vancomycin resistance protein YoaR